MERFENEVIVNKTHGLHARPATIFVQMANKFNSSVKMEKEGEVIDAKSIIAILSLGINQGIGIKLIIEGSDAGEAMDNLKDFLEKEDD